ncbi:MAG TPA: putative metal-binding motif-containing protein, partial [Candidatus Polarisedimenticolaceae bacterium]|nr:putative metal-binding motif-containing protein [Candidatus Polarisedimenticolaceae bacterium]
MVGTLTAFAFALPSLATTKTVTVDRRLPVNQYCPIDNRDFDLTFVAEQAEVDITIEAFNTTTGGIWIQNRLDNIAVIDKASYDAHHVVPMGFESCYGAPGDPNAPALDFGASGTFERYLGLFDGSAGGWDLNHGAFYQGGVSAPRNPALGTDTTGGALGLGILGNGNAVVSTSLHLANLTPGTQYIVTGWWYVKDTSRPLMVTIDMAPCLDDDGDGVTDCAGDCDVRNPRIKPGAPETCDGVDNDCDGQIDEDPPCDRVCDVPQVLLSEGRLTTSTVGSTGPSLVWTGNRYTVYFKEVSTTFVAETHSDGLLVGTAHPAGSVSVPDGSVVWTGREYGALTSGANGLYFQRLAPDGTSLSGPTLLSGSEYASGGQIAWNGSVYGAVWVATPWQPAVLKFQRINPLAVGFGSTIDLGTPGTISPAVIVAGGGTFGIAWSDRRDGSEGEIYFARISSGGS